MTDKDNTKAIIDGVYGAITQGTLKVVVENHEQIKPNQAPLFPDLNK